MELSRRLENLLEEHNLTQRQLSTELHIAPSTLNGYLRRNREPDFATLIKLAKYFKVSTDYLLGLHDVPDDKTLTAAYSTASSADKRVIWTLLERYGGKHGTTTDR